jgi:signal transduction histidine kinase
MSARHSQEERAAAAPGVPLEGCIEATLEGQNRILELIAKNAPLGDTLDAIASLIESQAPETRCSILLLRDGRLHHGTAPSLPAEYSRLVEGLAIGPTAGSCGTAAFLKRPVIVTDIATDPLWAAYREVTLPFGLRACWSTPIFSNDGSVLGTFAIYTAAPAAPTPYHLKLIEVATHMASIATERHLADESLKERAAQLAEADRKKDEFLALLAHELRNPLAPILMALEVVRIRQNDSASFLKYVPMLNRQVRHLKRLVDDLLDVSRITRGKIELTKERVCVDAFCARAIELATALIEARHHRLHVSLPSPPLEVDADSVRMAQVVSNLLGNAAIYAKPSADIYLSAALEDENVTIRVKDTGIGMSRETLAHVFELFAQGDRSRAREYGGLGVGLALVRQLVEMHGGSVEALSEGLGRGSELVIRLPVPEVPRGHGLR